MSWFCLETAYAAENHENDKEDGAISFHVYEFKPGEKYTKSKDWENTVHYPKVTIYDDYGNLGQFSVVVDEETHYEIPGLGE